MNDQPVPKHILRLKWIMQGNMKEMSDMEVADVVTALLNQYIPKCEAALHHPDLIKPYRLRAVAAMEEYAERQKRAITDRKMPWWATI